MTIMDTGTIPTVSAGFFLRAARESAGLTQQELAERLQVDRTTIRDAENNLRKPRNERVIAWAMACGVKPAWLQWHVDLALDASVDLDLTGAEGVLRACRDSNPKPSDLYPVGGSCQRCGRSLGMGQNGLCSTCRVNPTLTADHRTGSARSDWVLAA